MIDFKMGSPGKSKSFYSGFELIGDLQVGTGCCCSRVMGISQVIFRQSLPARAAPGHWPSTRPLFMIFEKVRKSYGFPAIALLVMPSRWTQGRGRRPKGSETA